MAQGMAQGMVQKLGLKLGLGIGLSIGAHGGLSPLWSAEPLPTAQELLQQIHAEIGAGNDAEHPAPGAEAEHEEGSWQQLLQRYLSSAAQDDATPEKLAQLWQQAATAIAQDGQWYDQEDQALRQQLWLGMPGPDAWPHLQSEIAAPDAAQAGATTTKKSSKGGIWSVFMGGNARRKNRGR